MVTSDSQRSVSVLLTTLDGGIAMNWEWMYLEQSEFMAFLYDLLRQMGFVAPRNVRFLRNEEGRLDWTRLRIPAEECRVQRVLPEQAVIRGMLWMRSSEVESRYGLQFLVEAMV